MYLVSLEYVCECVSECLHLRCVCLVLTHIHVWGLELYE